MDRTHLRSGTDPVCMHRMRRQRLLRGRKQYLLHRTGKQDPSQISKEVMDSGIEFPEMIEVNADNLKLQYSLEDGDFQEFGVYWSGNAAYADEVCVILAADGKADKVKDAVNQRLESQKTAFKDYVKEEYDRLCTTSVSTKGNYVYWVCTKDNAKANDIITKAIG